MTHDVDLLRTVLLYLETRQVSPRATVLIMIREEADYMDYSAKAIEDGLNRLLDLDYIEGPGLDAGGVWLFRRLTSKGVAFLKAARDPGDWERLKRHHAAVSNPPG